MTTDAGLHNLIAKVEQVFLMSFKGCVSGSVLECLYNQIDEVDTVSPMSLESCVPISVVELALHYGFYPIYFNWKPTCPFHLPCSVVLL